MRHKYDNRGAGNEGIWAQELYDFCCSEVGRKLKNATIKEDCAGVDRYDGNRAIDVKSRKFRLPIHTCWIELAASGGSIGSGWAYKPKWIAQLMIYEKENHLTKAIFGEYNTNDLVDLLKTKVDFNSKAYSAELYKLYTRWTDGKHRGTMTIVTYEDLESLKSFAPLEVPECKFDEVKQKYSLN